MFKRFAPVLVLSLLLSLALAACGEEAVGTIPSYSGATTLTVPDAIRSQFTGSIKDVKNVKVEAYKTSDGSSKVKTFFTDKFKNEGWTDKTGELTGQSGLKEFESLGGFVLGYEKGSSAAVVMGLPSIAAGALGFQNVSANDTLYMIFSGQK